MFQYETKFALITSCLSYFDETTSISLYIIIFFMMNHKIFQQELSMLFRDINFEEISYFMKLKLFEDSLVKVYFYYYMKQFPLL